jgi:hypothetical protein
MFSLEMVSIQSVSYTYLYGGDGIAYSRSRRDQSTEWEYLPLCRQEDSLYGRLAS